MTVLSSPGAEDSLKAEVSHGFAADEARALRVESPATPVTEPTSVPDSAAPPATEVAADFLQPGKLIKGRYELQEQVGAGGLGAVWSARHLGLSSSVALKFLKPELSNHAEAVSRFSAEARACFVLRSEHVVRVLDVDNFEGVPFIVMELLDGKDLRQMLGGAEPTPLSPTIVADYTLQVCEGLCAAHGSGIIHRDIKPENLFVHGVGTEACVKVLDFGISHVQAEYAREPAADDASDANDANDHGARAPAGTPPYMSPEQLRAAQPVDARSDVWSLGCVLYELLTGIAPFDRESTAESCDAVLTLEPTPVSRLRADLPAGLSEVIERCLQKDPSARYADAAQLAAALVSFGSGSYVDYPARCSAQLRGERRSSADLSAFRDSQPPAAPVSAVTLVAPADSSSEIAVLTGTESLLRRARRELLRDVRTAPKRTLWLSALSAVAVGSLIFAQLQPAAAPHIVTPSAPALGVVSVPLVTPTPVHARGDGQEGQDDQDEQADQEDQGDIAPTLHIESLLPAGASAVLEQGRAAPRTLDESSAQVSKRKARHLPRSGRYQRRQSSRDPDVGF